MSLMLRVFKIILNNNRKVGEDNPKSINYLNQHSHSNKNNLIIQNKPVLQVSNSNNQNRLHKAIINPTISKMNKNCNNNKIKIKASKHLLNNKNPFASFTLRNMMKKCLLTTNEQYPFWTSGSKTSFLFTNNSPL